MIASPKKAVKTRLLKSLPVEVQHGTAIRLLGIVLAILLVTITGIFVYLDRAFIQDLYNLYLVAVGILGTLAIQMVVWPGRFLPKKALPQMQSALTSDEIVHSIEQMHPQEAVTFESDVRPQMCRRGDPVLLIAQFKGKLVNGYISAYIRKPDGTFDGQPDWSTMASGQVGNLNGDPITTENHWHWTIPYTGPIGTYEFFLHAASYYFEPSFVVRWKRRYLRWRNSRRTDVPPGHPSVAKGDWHKVKVVE